MFWVLIVSLALAVIAGLLLGFGWISRPLECHPLTPSAAKTNLLVKGTV